MPPKTSREIYKTSNKSSRDSEYRIIFDSITKKKVYMVKNKLFAKSSSSFMQKIVEGTSLTSHSQMLGNGKYLKWKIFDADDIAKS